MLVGCGLCECVHVHVCVCVIDSANVVGECVFPHRNAKHTRKIITLYFDC